MIAKLAREQGRVEHQVLVGYDHFRPSTDGGRREEQVDILVAGEPVAA